MAYMVMPADIFFYSKVNQLPIIVYLFIKRTIVYKLNEIAIAMNCQLHSRELNIEIESGIVWTGDADPGLNCVKKENMWQFVGLPFGNQRTKSNNWILSKARY